MSHYSFLNSKDSLLGILSKDTLKKQMPMHRVVSAYGYAYSTKVEQLASEGFEFEEKNNNRGLKVKDYKKYLFNFEKEINISLDTLKKINEEKDFQI